MAHVMRIAALSIAATMIVGCANKQILRNEAIMTKKLGEAVSSLDELSDQSVSDRRVFSVMPKLPPAPVDKAFIELACMGEQSEHVVEHALGVYASRLKELDALAEGPADDSFRALFGSFKKVADARKKLPEPDEQVAAFKEQSEKVKKENAASAKRCRAIVGHDLRPPIARGPAATGSPLDAILIYINVFKSFAQLAEQTARAEAVKEYTALVVKPDLDLAHRYLAGVPHDDPFLSPGQGPDLNPDLTRLCATREGAANNEGELSETEIVALSEAHGRLGQLVARSRTTAVRTAYLHYLSAKSVDASSAKPQELAAAVRSAAYAADTLKRVDELVDLDVDCEILPKLKTSQDEFAEAVASGAKSDLAADNFVDALTNVQSLLEALGKLKD